MRFNLFQLILLKVVELKINAMETPAWNKLAQTFISPKHPGNELASYLKRKSRRVWEGLGVLFLERISNSQNFDYFDDFFSKRVFWEMSQRHFWKIPATFSVLELCVFSKVCFFH